MPDPAAGGAQGSEGHRRGEGCSVCPEGLWKICVDALKLGLPHAGG